MTLLHDQVCIVTGAGQGLGRAIALEMAKEGAAVALMERNADTLEKTAKEIAASGGKAMPYQLDLTDYAVYGRVVGEAQEESAFDLRDLLADRVRETHAVELAGFAAGIDLAVGSPGDGFRMIEGVAEIGERQQVALFGHGIFPHRLRGLTAESGGSIVTSKITEPSPECRKTAPVVCENAGRTREASRGQCEAG